MRNVKMRMGCLDCPVVEVWTIKYFVMCLRFFNKMNMPVYFSVAILVH